MRILIVGLVKNPQFKRIKEEGEKRGHIVDGCLSKDLLIKASNNEFKPTILGKKLESYDLIYLWAIAKRRWDWITTAYYLNRKYKTTIVNSKVIDPDYNYFLTPSIDYLRQTESKILYPKSFVIFSENALERVIKEMRFPLILKVAEGRQGKGVFKIGSKNELYNKVKELLTRVESLVVREFIPNDGDIRVFTVGYKAIGAMKRIPTKKGEFRSNISLGGRGEKFDLNKYSNINDIAEFLSKLTMTEIAGVDIVVNKLTGEAYVLEINPGPQFTGFEKYTGVNAAKEIIKYFEKLSN